MSGNQEQRRESNRRYRESHREQLNAYRRAYMAAHPEKRAKAAERRAAYNAQHREQVLAQKRRAERARQERLRKDEARRRANAERAAAWRLAHPERYKANHAAWAKAHRERRNELNRLSRARGGEAERAKGRDRNAARRADPVEREKDRQRRVQDRAKENARARAYRAADREAYNAYQREYRARERRRREPGLPVRHPHRSTINERIRNEQDAAAFFGRRVWRFGEERLAQEGRDVARAAEAHRHAGERFALQRAWAHENWEARQDAAAEMLVRDAAAFEKFAALNTQRIREDVDMDNTARMLRGKTARRDPAVDTAERLEVEFAEQVRTI